MILARLFSVLILLLPITVMGFSDYTSSSLAIIDSIDVPGDTAKTVDLLRSLGFVDAEVSRYAPAGAVGFRAYRGQFTVVAPDPEKHRVTVSFSEGSKSFSVRAKTAYAAMLSALQAEFGIARVERPKELSFEGGANSSFNTDWRDKTAPAG